MPNPFEDESASYLVLRNLEEQYSLWPARNIVPAGWSIAFPANTRQACLDWINHTWSDMRPRSLRDSMSGLGKNN